MSAPFASAATHGATMARVRGLTLIELVVALAIFAILGVMSYRALAEISLSETRLADGFARWRSLSRCLQRIDADLLQVVAPAGTPSAPPFVLLSAPEGGPELQLLRSDPLRGARRVAFRLVGDRLYALRWNGRDAVGEAQAETLLSGVRGLRWQFVSEATRFAAWPAAAEQAPLLPDAVIVEIDLAGIGVVTRIVALR